MKDIKEQLVTEFDILGFNRPTNPTQAPEYEKPSHDEKAKTIHLAKHDTTTVPEGIFGRVLIARLKEEKLYQEVSYQEYLPIPLKPKRWDQNTRSRIEEFFLKVGIPMERFIVQRPDFILLRYGLVIEADGSVHDDRIYRIHKDEIRDDIYKILGLDCYVVRNHQINNPGKLKHVIDEIVQLIKQRRDSPIFKLQQQKTKTALSRARHKYNQIFQRLKRPIPVACQTFKRKQKPWMHKYLEHLVTNQYGGCRIIIRK